VLSFTIEQVLERNNGRSPLALLVVGRAYGPIRGRTKPTFRVVCSIEQRSLISLLNAAKKQPGALHRRRILPFGHTDREI